MYQKILAPLDGSKFSEHSLNHIRKIATKCQRLLPLLLLEIVLLRVVKPSSAINYASWATAGADLDKIEKQRQAEAKIYLSQVADNLRKEGIVTQTAVVRGMPADEILNYANEKHVDLIIMSTHRRSGVSRWVSRSVTQRLLRHCAIPVLIVPVKPRGGKTAFS